MDRRLVLLSPVDNCVVVAEALPAGADVEIDGATVKLRTAVGVGHKLARCAIAAGAPVRKYDASIGHATADIVPGEHIHFHNLASDYHALHAGDGRD
jgi:altronate dehydratase small subunit